MPRVKSGDMHGISDDPLHTKEKVPNSIGGSELPLLQRLRHFKEKQVSYYQYRFCLFNRMSKKCNSHSILY